MISLLESKTNAIFSNDVLVGLVSDSCIVHPPLIQRTLPGSGGAPTNCAGHRAPRTGTGDSVLDVLCIICFLWM